MPKKTNGCVLLQVQRRLSNKRTRTNIFGLTERDYGTIRTMMLFFVVRTEQDKQGYKALSL